ncbi:MAG: proline--tRNA ligase, partial [Candidatus Omnitrophica bacterium]|nr:proline--tRNA ligase [Candidatus Omnitrophota bacterium]
SLSAIEVGHIFKLGTKYSASMGATFLDEDGKQKPFIMGCYGIGVTRILAAVIETHHDEAGIRWPLSLAPYPVVVVPINCADPKTRQAAEALSEQLSRDGLDLLLDDREVSGGVKLKDADLIGFPVRILMSEKTLQQSSAELKLRDQPQATLVKLSEVPSALKKLLDKGAAVVG